MKPFVRLGFILSFVFLVQASLLSEESEPAATTEPAPKGATITGQGTIELRINATRYLRNMGLALLPESKVTELKEIRNNRWLENASRLKFNAGYYNLDLKSIGYFASCNAVQVIKSDEEGKYRFTAVAPGQYRIYGQYKSKYASGYWLIPVNVQSEDDRIEININNENLEEIYNREVRYNR